MKRIIAILAVLTIFVGMAGCSNAQRDSVSKEKYDALKNEYDLLKEDYDTIKAQLENNLENSTENTSEDNTVQIPEVNGDSDTPSNTSSDDRPSGKFDEDTVISQLDVKELSYSNNYWNYSFLLVTNNSEYDISFSVNVNFYDENGDLIGAKSESEEAVESGYTVLLFFMPDEKYATMDYEFSVDEEVFYDCVLSDLSYEGTVAKNKVILSVTNNGDEPAEFVEANVLFFNGGKLVGYSSAYITDDDFEIKPGKTINEEMDCYESFDSYQVYFAGRR